jgi:hypothetical protein
MTTLLIPILLGLILWACLPLPLSRKRQTRHERNVLMRAMWRRQEVLIWWWLTRPEVKRK